MRFANVSARVIDRAVPLDERSPSRLPQLGAPPAPFRARVAFGLGRVVMVTLFAVFAASPTNAKDPNGPRYKLGISLAELDNVVRVTNVNPGSLADQMGFKVNDVLADVKTLEEFADKLPAVNAIFAMKLLRPGGKTANAPGVVHIRGKIVANGAAAVKDREFVFQRVEPSPKEKPKETSELPALVAPPSAKKKIARALDLKTDADYLLEKGGKNRVYLLKDRAELEAFAGPEAARALLEQVSFDTEMIAAVSWLGPQDVVLDHAAGAGDVTFYMRPVVGAPRGQFLRLGIDFFAIPNRRTVSFETKSRASP